MNYLLSGSSNREIASIILWKRQQQHKLSSRKNENMKLFKDIVKVDYWLDFPLRSAELLMHGIRYNDCCINVNSQTEWNIHNCVASSRMLHDGIENTGNNNNTYSQEYSCR